MDHKHSERRKSGRVIPYARLLSIISAFTLLGIFVTPLTGVALESAQAAPIGSVTVTLTPATLSQVVNAQALITATVKFTNSGIPAPLLAVNFTVSGVNSQTGTTITNRNGVAVFSYTGANPGTDTVTAMVGSTPSNDVTVTWESSAPTLELTPSTQDVQIEDSVSITATLARTSGTIDGIPIRYSVTGANPTTGTATTDGSGEATISYTGHAIGTDTITAYADLNSNGSKDGDDPSFTATVVWSGDTITLSPTTQTLSIGSQVSIDASVLNGSTGVPNILVRYSVSGANSSVGGSVSTDANGDATFHYTGNFVGTDTIKAYADLNSNNIQDSNEPSATATVYWTGAGLALSPSTQTVTAGTQASITATLTNPTISVIGVTIRYSITGANTGAGSVTTGTNGSAIISYTGINTGTDTINAYVDFNNNGYQDSGEPTATATVTRTGSASLSLSPSMANPTVGTTAYVSAALTRSGGAVSNVAIRYSIAGANSTSGSVTTDGNGNTVISYTGSNAGTDTISAFADLNGNGVQDSGEPAASTTITWMAAPPPSVFQPAQPASAISGCTYFPQTQHNLCAGFLAYWNKFGGLAVFGMPLTEEFQENGTTVQYFERARFEWHPGAYPSHFDVLLGLLGNQVTQGRGSEVPFMPASANSATGCTYYAATGHNLCGGFAAYWNQFGGLAIYGYPISEEFQEKNPDTGQVYTVQYFQRARFEWHPGEWPARYDVELGRLGAQVLQMNYGVSYY